MPVLLSAQSMLISLQLACLLCLNFFYPHLHPFGSDDCACHETKCLPAVCVRLPLFPHLEDVLSSQRKTTHGVSRFPFISLTLYPLGIGCEAGCCQVVAGGPEAVREGALTGCSCSARPCHSHSASAYDSDVKNIWWHW